MLYIIEIAESGFAEMRCQWREDGLRYGRTVNPRCFLNQESDEFGQFFRHLMNMIEVRFRIVDIAEIAVIIVGRKRIHLFIPYQLYGLAHDAGHSEALLSVAGTLHGYERPLPVFAKGWNHLLDPFRIIIAEIAEIAA